MLPVPNYDNYVYHEAEPRRDLDFALIFESRTVKDSTSKRPKK